jgi:hypothetical protein
MIILDIQPYCQDCLVFDPDVERPQKVYNFDEELIISDTVIRCSRRRTCAGIKRYLEKELQKGEKE